ncbi:hypothetical protein STANM309S_06483 [Streptomyces tanashiensis]
MRLEHVGRRHGLRGPWVLREVSLTLPAAALVRVVGTNGSGKSTLLRLLAGVDAPTEGRVGGRPARTAYVPERFPAALPFTAVDYLVHLGRVQGLGRAAARARAGEWLERFGAGEHAGTELAALSKGTSQKVAVAQALLADPALLVLDARPGPASTPAPAPNWTPPSANASRRARRSSSSTTTPAAWRGRRWSCTGWARGACGSRRLRSRRRRGTRAPRRRPGRSRPRPGCRWQDPSRPPPGFR